jgi:hypothetical protein
MPREKGPHMPVAEFQGLLDLVCVGSENESREARKKIQAMQYEPAGNMDELAREFAGRAAVFDDIKNPKNRASFASLLSVFAWHGRETCQKAMIDFALKAMQDQNGQVREMARRGANWFRLEFRHEKDLEKHLEVVESIIARYKPDDMDPESPEHINDLPVSVYKTFVAYWHDCVRGMMGEAIGADRRAQRLGIPGYQYDDEDWMEENTVDHDGEADGLWAKGNGDPKSALPALKTLEGEALAQLKTALAEFGFEPHVLNVVESELDAKGNMAGTDILMQLMQRGAQLPGKADIPELLDDPGWSAIVRGLQFLVNHRVVRNVKNDPVSEFLIQCAMARAEYGRHKPDSWKVFAELIHDAHAATLEFVGSRAVLRKKNLAELEDRIEKIERKDEREHKKNPKKNYHPLDMGSFLAKGRARLAAAEREDAEMAGIARYAIDWLAMLEPWGVQRKTPRQLAAIGLAAVREANFEARVYGPSGYENCDLAKFGGWQTQSTLSWDSRLAFRSLFREMQDPDMLILWRGESEDGEEDDEDYAVVDGDAQVFSPAGIRKGLVRYFGVFAASEFGLDYRDFKRLEEAAAAVEKENSGKVETEEPEFHEDHAVIEMLISPDLAVDDVVRAILKHANHPKPFLNKTYFITNMHRPRLSEIREYLADVFGDE